MLKLDPRQLFYLHQACLRHYRLIDGCKELVVNARCDLSCTYDLHLDAAEGTSIAGLPSAEVDAAVCCEADREVCQNLEIHAAGCAPWEVRGLGPTRA